MMNSAEAFPQKNKIRTVYESYVPVLRDIMANIESSLRRNLKLSSNPTYKSRVKSFNSYYSKILRLKEDESEKSKTLVTLTDMMGIRVICAFLSDLPEVVEQIKAKYDVKEVEYKGENQSFREFGYESIHVLIGIPDYCMPDYQHLELPDNLVCEIQIRTILQDAWAEVEHELIYKTEFSPFDMPLRRKLASMNASLTLADITFQEIRDYQRKLQTETENRRESFYKQVDDATQEHFGLGDEAKKEGNISRVSPYVRGTIDDMLLEAIHAHNSGELERAVEIYTEIIGANPTPSEPVLAVIHKHRGMAYFAQSNYESALQDFQDSVKYDKNGFRAYYYIGIVYSVLEDHQKAVEAFTRSLEINKIQSHTHYRRAVSLFKLGQDTDALADITAAEQLGMNDADCEALKEKIVKKVGLGM